MASNARGSEVTFGFVASTPGFSTWKSLRVAPVFSSSIYIHIYIYKSVLRTATELPLDVDERFERLPDPTDDTELHFVGRISDRLQTGQDLTAMGAETGATGEVLPKASERFLGVRHRGKGNNHLLRETLR
eukprot:8288990-Pyramimonas_sp.AAC.1